jgi:hypothetical protein
MQQWNDNFCVQQCSVIWYVFKQLSMGDTCGPAYIQMVFQFSQCFHTMSSVMFFNASMHFQLCYSYDSQHRLETWPFLNKQLKVATYDNLGDHGTGPLPLSHSSAYVSLRSWTTRWPVWDVAGSYWTKMVPSLLPTVNENCWSMFK